jgi:hypothetical protein
MWIASVVFVPALGCQSESDDEQSTGGSDATGTAGEGGGPDSGAGGSGGHVDDPCPTFAVEVVEVVYGPGAGFGQEGMPGIVLGPPMGKGATQGSLDVVALGNGGSISLAFGAQTIVDGPGADFIVFENAFLAGGDATKPFAELATVEVSADGRTWTAFECTATEFPYGACAGWHPVLANADENPIDPTDPTAAGGDAFDLADIAISEARYVRIVDRVDQEGLAGSFDLDAVALVHATCAAR